MANKRVLFLCAHNQSRSVTAEGLLTGERGYEVRSRALWKGTSRRVTKHDGQWATDVYVMMPGMIPVAEEVGIPRKKLHTLFVPDAYIACEDKLLVDLKFQLEAQGVKVAKSLPQAKKDCEDVYSRKMGIPRQIINWNWYETEFERHGSFPESGGYVSRPRKKVRQGDEEWFGFEEGGAVAQVGKPEKNFDWTEEPSEEELVEQNKLFRHYVERERRK